MNHAEGLKINSNPSISLSHAGPLTSRAVGSASQRSQAAASDKIHSGKVSRLPLKGIVRSFSSEFEISSRSSACFCYINGLTSSGISISTIHVLLSSCWRALYSVTKRPAQQGAWRVVRRFLASIHGLPLSFPLSTDENKDDYQDGHDHNSDNRYNDGYNQGN